MTDTVAVLGPGAVGGALAVGLARTGTRVICVARADTAAAIARDGLTLVSDGETSHARPEAVEQLAEPVDLLLVTVKSVGLAQALALVEPGTVARGVALSLLNGVEHMEAIRSRFGTRVAAGSIGRLEAYRRGIAEVVQKSGSPLVTVASDTMPATALERAVAPLRTVGVELRPGDSEAAVLWEKAVRLAPLAALTAVTQRPLGEVIADAATRAQLDAGIREACAVAGAVGIALSPEAEWEMIGGMPPTLTTSTARDVAAGRPSEADAIVGGVVRAGRRLGVATPTLDALLTALAGR